MSDKGDVLRTNQTLEVGDYLISSNRTFKAQVQPDGNFVLYYILASGFDEPHWESGTRINIPSQYRLTMQSDGNVVLYEGPPDTRAIWNSGVILGTGQYSLVMQSDGNLVAYRNPGRAIWATATECDFSSIVLTNLRYNTNAAEITRPALDGYYQQSLKNDTDTMQGQSFQFEVSCTETQSWSSSEDIKLGMSMEIQGGVPFFEDTKLTVSAETSTSTTVGKTTSTTRKFSGTIPVKVLPHTEVYCVASVTTAHMIVPYEADAIFVLSNGERLKGIISGQFEATSAYQFDTSFAQHQLVSAPV